MYPASRLQFRALFVVALAAAVFTFGCHKKPVEAPPPPPPPQPEATWRDLFNQEVKDAYFDYDKSDLRPDARSALNQTADFLKKYPEAKVTVEGHCDER